MATFFNYNSFFIDQNVNFLKFSNSYNIYNEQGEKIGTVAQKMQIWQKILQLIIKKGILPFKLEILNNNNEVEAKISRGFTMFMSTIKICNAEGNLIGTIKQKFKLFKPTFQLLDASSVQIGEISGDWKAWDFLIKDEHQTIVGKINKKWAGVAKEMFTNADKYNVNFEWVYNDETKKLIAFSGAICIDMVFKENK
jgi:uncharacterized protein YxjI